MFLNCKWKIKTFLNKSLILWLLYFWIHPANPTPNPTVDPGANRSFFGGGRQGVISNPLKNGKQSSKGGAIFMTLSPLFLRCFFFVVVGLTTLIGATCNLRIHTLPFRTPPTSPFLFRTDSLPNSLHFLVFENIFSLLGCGEGCSLKESLFLIPRKLQKLPKLLASSMDTFTLPSILRNHFKFIEINWLETENGN